MDWYEPEAESEKKEKVLIWKNWLKWVSMLFASLVYTWFHGGFLSFTMLYIVLLLPVTSFAVLGIGLVSFKIAENLSERIFVKGEKAKYRLFLGNESPFPIPYVTITMHLEGRIICNEMKSMHVSLLPFGKKEYEYGMPLNYRGRYSIGVKSIVFRDFMGLFFLKHQPLEQKSILVKPRIRFLLHKKIPAAMISEGNVLAGLYEAGNDEMVDIRKYVPGDSLRKMHWKLAAKTGNLMVRDMRNELDNDILFLIDVTSAPEQNSETLTNEDCLVEEAVANAQYLLTRGMPVRLCFWREEPVVLRAYVPGDFLKVYELLSEVKFNQEGLFEDIIDNFLESGASRSLVYLFTVRLTHGTIEKVIQLKSRGFDMEIFYLIHPEADNDTEVTDSAIREQLGRNGIRVHLLVPDIISVANEEVAHASKQKVG